MSDSDDDEQTQDAFHRKSRSSQWRYKQDIPEYGRNVEPQKHFKSNNSTALPALAVFTGENAPASPPTQEDTTADTTGHIMQNDELLIETDNEDVETEDEDVAEGSDAQFRWLENANYYDPVLNCGDQEPIPQANEGFVESEEEDEEFGNNLPNNANTDEKIYEGSDVTVAESMLSILLFVVTFSLTGEAITALLSLLSLHCMKENNLKKSLYMFRKYFNNISTPINVRVFCEHCDNEIDRPRSGIIKGTFCPSCKLEIKNASYLVEVPVLYQVRQLFKRENFFQTLQYRFHRKKTCVNGYEDIYDGKIYKQYFDNGGFLSENTNISFSMYTDGIPVFKSSKISFWPVYMAINELPYKLRANKENLIMSGLWCSTKKPDMNILLEPYHSVLQKFFNGVECALDTGDTILVKAMVLCISCDLPARAMCLNMNQFNGNYGCSKCLQKGETYVIGPKKRCHVYPIQPDIDGPARTHMQTVQDGVDADITNETTMGIKGPTILSAILPDIIACVPCDVMHCLYLGVTRKLLYLWFTASYMSQKFSLYPYLQTVDRRLCEIQPPAYIQRIPRTISEHLKYWKASELKNWLLYYSIAVLADIMEPTYFKHHVLLVAASYILSSRSVSPSNLTVACTALQLYVTQFQQLYGLRHMSANIHQLLHLGNEVESFGPLWVTSCFPYEDFNGLILKVIHGTQYVFLQVPLALSYSVHLPHLLRQLPENSRVATFCDKLQSKSRLKKTERVSDNVYAVGVLKKPKFIPINIYTALSKIISGQIGTVSMFTRALLNGILISSTAYTRMTKKNSTCVKFKRGNMFGYGIVTWFVKHKKKCICGTTINYVDDTCDVCQEIEYFVIIKRLECHAAGFTSGPPSHVCLPCIKLHNQKVDGEIFALRFEEILYVCFYVTSRDRSYIVDPANMIEFE